MLDKIKKIFKTYRPTHHNNPKQHQMDKSMCNHQQKLSISIKSDIANYPRLEFRIHKVMSKREKHEYKKGYAKN